MALTTHLPLKLRRVVFCLRYELKVLNVICTSFGFRPKFNVALNAFHAALRILK
jgi:hypothetical protein